MNAFVSHYIHMQAGRGDTYEPNGYLDGNRPQEIEMRNYSQPPKPQAVIPEQPPAYNQSSQLPPAKEAEESSLKGYFLHWAAFLIALLVNLAAWGVTYYVVYRQYSYYYYNQTLVSTYVDNVSYGDSRTIFGTLDPTDTLAITMGLVYSWLLWKLPFVAYAVQLTGEQPSRGLRIGSCLALLLVLLGADVLLTLFAKGFYGEWIFYGIYSLLTVAVVVVNNMGINRVMQSLANVLIPLALIALLYSVYTLLLPKLYSIYLENMSTTSALFLVFYLYPLFDLLIYSLVLGLGSKIEDNVKGFFTTIHFLMIGYAAGLIMMVGYTEVEFYYLLGYFIFRNVFVNHIMRRWQTVVSNPPALPGWGLAYYMGYALSYLPVVGLAGRLVVAKGFLSYLYSKTPTALYGAPNPLYPSSLAPTVTLGTNFGLSGNIFWLAGVIIWVGMTFSQRYNRKQPCWYDLFYYLGGLQLFYVGLAAGLSTFVLAVSAHI